MKVATAIIVSATFVLLGWGYLREHDARVRAAALAQRSQDSLSTVIRAEREQAAAKFTADSLVAERVIRQREAALAAERRRADSLAGLSGKLADSLLVMVGGDSVLSGFVKRVIDALADEREARAQERVAADSALASKTARIVQLESVYTSDLAAVRAQLAEAMIQLNAANHRARQRHLLRDAAFLGLGLVGGHLLR